MARPNSSDGGRLTADAVYSAAAPDLGQSFLWDREVPGFGLRITANGAKSFILNYRFNDPHERRKSNAYRFTIGSAKAAPRGTGWSIEEARKEADRWSKLIDTGETHPLAQRRGNRQAVRAAREAETFKDAVAEYIEHEQRGRKGNATAGEVERAILKDCAEWLDWPLKDIAATDIGKLLRRVRDGGGKDKAEPKPYMANRLHAYLRTFFSWCAKPDVAKIAASPMTGMERPWDGEEVRDRVFDDREMRTIWRATDAIGDIAGAYVKVLMLTGKRSRALARMQWVDIDDAGTWSPPTDPRRRKRTKRQHVTPLPKLAQRIIAPLRPQDGEGYVFPGRIKGTHLDPGTPLRERVQQESGVDDFFFHAIKHTLETRLAELKVPPHVRDLILDHAPARGAGKGYDHYDYREEMGEAIERWAAHVERVVSPKGARVLR